VEAARKLRQTRFVLDGEAVIVAIGPELFRAACRMGLEGLVSKHRDRPYQVGRSKHWIKVKNRMHPAMYRVIDALAYAP
jgi:ATP-dependent DNA ligase